MAKNEEHEDYGFLQRPSIKFDEVHGLDEIKTTLIERIVLPLRFPKLFKGKRYPKTFLIYGAHGTGKALYAKAAAEQIPDCSIIHRYVFDFMSTDSDYVNREILEMFEAAQSHSPCVLILESFESIGNRECEPTRRLVTEILLRLHDMYETGSDVIVVFITQRPQHFPSPLFRKCVYKIYIPLPRHIDRRNMAKMWLSEDKSESELTNDDFEEIAVFTDGCTGADVYGLCGDIMMEPARAVQNAQYFKKIVTEEDSQKWVPCTEDVPDAIKMSWTDIPSPSDLGPVPVNSARERQNFRNFARKVSKMSLP